MRILVTRTDRMGDVILSIPAVKRLREVLPDSHIAFMVAAENRELVENEKYIDEIIVYDKKRAQKGIFSNLLFSWGLRKKKFDMAIALHPSNRTHFVIFAAGIPRRIGYDKKWPIFLTDKLPHEKQLGKKHEVDYNLGVIASAGFNIAGCDRKPAVTVPEKTVQAVKKLLEGAGVSGKIAVIHPGASCRSKTWPPERFAETADILSERYGVSVVIIGDTSCSEAARSISGRMRKKPLDLTGRLGLGQLAALFSLASVTVSNDSGPAHLAAAAGSPVVVIFGRNDPGISPARWAPVTEKSRILHRPPDCSPCLAHNCRIDFLCLRNIEVGEVVSAAGEIMA
ncbi:MAG TPA: glycosyltransferase family 9 protein [Candidatus Omnitrophota bacterium]|nr:glycosyltransferase family 9 protein [Candidatus Omnitrophota bacterium]